MAVVTYFSKRVVSALRSAGTATGLAAAFCATLSFPAMAADAQLKTLAAIGTNMRADAMVQFARLRGHFSAAAVDGFLPRSAPPGLARTWSHFFESAVVLVDDGLTDHPVIGFYNPLVDGWVLAALHWQDSGWGLTEMSAVTGARLRTAAGIPLTMASNLPSPILRNYRLSAESFAALYPQDTPPAADLSGDRTKDAATILVRTNAAQGLAHALAGNARLATAVNAYRNAAIKGDAAGLRRLFPADTVTPPEAIVAVPLAVRQSLKVAAVFGNHGDVQVALTSPRAGRVLILLELRRGALGRMVLQDVLAADYAPLSEIAEPR